MKTAAFIFPITTIVVFIQAFTGGLAVLDFYDLGLHETTGYVVFVLALVCVGVAFGMKPKFNLLRYTSLALLILAGIQAYLGYAAETSDMVVAAHFANALLIYAVALAMAFYSMKWGKSDARAPMPATA